MSASSCGCARGRPAQPCMTASLRIVVQPSRLLFQYPQAGRLHHKETRPIVQVEAPMQLLGIHHLTAVSADAPGNLAFYTKTLGMRLVKKTVNQDDVSAYHLFYADGEATPGTDLTFFDWPTPRERRGTHSIVRTGLRAASEASLRWWAERFGRFGVTHDDIAHRDGRPTLDFEDSEGQRLSLVVDGGKGEAHPWHKSPVPPEH